MRGYSEGLGLVENEGNVLIWGTLFWTVIYSLCENNLFSYILAVVLWSLACLSYKILQVAILVFVMANVSIPLAKNCSLQCSLEYKTEYMFGLYQMLEDVGPQFKGTCFFYVFLYVYKAKDIRKEWFSICSFEEHLRGFGGIKTQKFIHWGFS